MRIRVTKPFTVRFDKETRREFGKGEHELTKAELGHWFVAGCIAEGRATVLPEETPASSPSGSDVSKTATKAKKAKK